MKYPNVPNTSAFDDEVLYELEEELAERSISAMDAVKEAFEGADVDIQAQKIIWNDGERRTIEQSAQKIAEDSGENHASILSHIVCWLTMDFVPNGLTQEQMISFEAQMEEWINDCDVVFK